MKSEKYNSDCSILSSECFNSKHSFPGLISIRICRVGYFTLRLSRKALINRLVGRRHCEERSNLSPVPARLPRCATNDDAGSRLLGHPLCRGCLFFIFSILAVMTSCVSEEVASVPDSEPDGLVEKGYMKIHLNTPELQIPAETYGTRAMNGRSEEVIDSEILNVLVFSCDDGGAGDISETFYCKASVSGSVVYDENDGSKASVVVKLTKSVSSDDYYRIVVIANHDMSGIEMLENGTTKEGILSQLTYSASDKWNAGSPFPMWGEGVPVLISDSMPSPTIELCRALARIDVGLNFVIDDGKQTEQASGIPDFKLSEVLVYRTYDRGYVAPLNVEMSGSQLSVFGICEWQGTEVPSVVGAYSSSQGVECAYSNLQGVPPDALRYADDSPLDYIIPVSGGVNSYVREIYIPEADLPPTPDNSNIHCLVIGGYYQNSAVASYYRLDFAKEDGSGIRTYLPILRNHRYVFNITRVNGPGFASAMSALESMPTAGNVDYDLIAWDATIHEMETQGQYYFGIDNRDLLAEAPSTNSAPNNKFTVKYQTNYPLSPADPIRLVWASAQDGNGGTGGVPSPAFDAKWQANGKNILITVNNDNLTYTLLTDTLYVYAGSFVKKIVVQQKYYYVNQLVIPWMNILVIADINSSFGYAISTVNSGSYKVFNSPNNFGPNDNSIVKIEGFSLIPSSTYNFNSNTSSDAYKWVTGIGNGGKIADIVYIAHGMVFNTQTSRLLVEYLEKGGVIVAFNEDFSVGVLANTLFKSNNITTKPYGPAGAVYPFPAHTHFKLSAAELQDVLRKFDSDPILNGPFGDVRDKQWGEDRNSTMHLNNLPQSDPDFTMYSSQMNISSQVPVFDENYINAFKYESIDRNIVWFGDGGFMVAGSNGEPNTVNTASPLNWNLNTFFPEAKLDYGNYTPMPVYNSIVFCNIMAWAIQKSESLRKKRENP